MLINIANKPLKSIADVIKLYNDAIKFRDQNHEQSETVARAVFDATHSSQLPFKLPKSLEQIRFEFGALEAPGAFDEADDFKSQLEFENYLWQRLEKQIKKIKPLR